ncbi:hypothetical protein [Telmatospirillum sp. J64-1]|uniref:hypothetical protein n=1 Tax=Telmatospirillum sp. J64-1 TaxID=2502183 RepID=UPI00115DB83E|nr:hypothetical protein [Telmatospirillum sp. J64-1]
MTETLKAICLGCGQEGEWGRNPLDPPEATTVRTSLCNICDDGDFMEPCFFDANGKEILPSPLQTGEQQ